MLSLLGILGDSCDGGEGMSKRRGNNEGSITKRGDGRWEARVTFPDGKRKSIYGKTRQEVARRLAQVIRDRDQGLPVVDERRLLKDYLEWWLDSVKHQIRSTSWIRAKHAVVLHIIPELGNIPIVRVSAHQVQSLYTKWLEDGLAPSTVRRMHAVFHRAMEDAVRLGVIQRNIVDLAQAPRINQSKMRVLSPDDARSLLEASAGDRFEALYVLALTTGMRRGELFALRWQDIDLIEGVLWVKATLNPDRTINEPKTRSSRRRILLTKLAVTALHQHYQRQQEEKQRAGELWDTSFDLVFPDVLGRHVWPGFIAQEHLPRLLRRAGLPKIRFHDLRHTAATLMISRGVNPKVVSEMLGHSSIVITLSVYAHVLPDMQQAAVTVMDALLGGS
jgi:integrase